MTNRNTKFSFLFFQKAIIFLLVMGMSDSIFAQHPIRVVVAGLNHDHVYGILNQYSKGLVDIVGIAEPNKAFAAEIQQALSFTRFLVFY